MVSKTGAEFHEKSDDEASHVSTSNPEAPKDTRANLDCPAVLEPSEDGSLFRRERIRSPLRTYNSILTSFNSIDLQANSDEALNDGDYGQQLNERRSLCCDLFHRYKNFAVKFWKPRSSVTPKDPGANLDCPVVLEPSEDEPLFRRGRIRRPLETCNSSSASFNSIDLQANSDEALNDEDYGQQLGVRRSLCCHLFHRYKNLAVKFRKSKYIYAVQILLAMLPFSAVATGVKYSDSCPASHDLVSLSVFNGVLGIMFIGQWMLFKLCRPDDRPCEGQQRCFILVFFLLVSTLLELEIYTFIQMSVCFKPNTTNYCHKTFYDFTYYKYVAAFISMFGVLLLYIPDYRSLASGVDFSDPVTTSCYRHSLEESE